YIDYTVNGDKSKTLDICRKFSAIINKEIYIIKNNEKEIVKCIDINSDGNLIIQDKEGNKKEIVSGEVSIRGEHGYV
ncbi:biotin--[acetyl-CoA-carboxylase] ligase, partial [Turicibacter sanguinis]|nr:biotin--[acetyl-CoA-carboxylase] ligase [Turicibacter sanguinis]